MIWASAATRGSASPNRTTVQLILLTVLYVAVFATTVPKHIGDTYWYGLDVSRYLAGGTGPGQGRIWEFAHVIWRPLAYVLYRLFGGIITSFRGNDLHTNVIWIMMAVNATAGWCGCLAFSRVLTKLSGPRTGLLLTGSFLCTNGVLNYMHAGSAWMPGLAMLCVAFWLAQGEGAPWVVGIVSAASVLFWVPYVISIPGVFAFKAMSSGPDMESKRTLRWMGQAALAFCLTIGGTYGIAIGAGGIRTPDQFRSWVKSSENENAQSYNWARAVSGIPRSFVDTGDDGLMLKRYFFKDPYASVGKRDLLTGGVGRMVIFYLFFALVIWQLWREPADRATLWLFLGNWALMIVLAVIVFEPGSRERYLPVYPVTYIAIAQCLRKNVTGSWSRSIIACVAGPLLIATNWVALGSTGLEKEYNAVIERRMSLDRIIPKSAIAIMLEGDPLTILPAVNPLDARFRPEHFEPHWAVEPGTTSEKTWRQDFVQIARASWDKGGEVWISKRLLAERPKPEWRWVEGENGVLWWKDLRSYFRALETDRETEGEDGFVRVAHSQGAEVL